MSVLGAGIPKPRHADRDVPAARADHRGVRRTGLLFGFFLPGDSLLFTVGVLAAQMHPADPLSLLRLTVPAAARQTATMSVR